MMYRRTTTELIEDDKIFDGLSLAEICRRTGIVASELSIIRSGKRIPSEKWYLEFKRKLTH